MGAASGLMERARLAFINATKEHVIGSSKRLERLPIRRPSEYLPGGTGDSPSTADSSS